MKFCYIIYMITILRGRNFILKKIKKFFRFLLLIILIFVGIFIYRGYDKYQKAVYELPLDTAVENIRNQKNYTYFTDLPDIYIHAVVSVEDRRFYHHNGFDIIGTLRAIITDIKTKSLAEGGSTITQQLAKNMYFHSDSSPERKIAEIFMAFNIEREFSKNEIFELYVNVIYYGSGYYNIYDASIGYFKTIPEKMSDYEATLLAGIPNAPSVYAPDKNLHLAEKRQQKVLKSMVSCGYISNEEMEQIKKSV